ncbi:cyclic nucleotide-binding domain-containing protein [Candidatus Parabeggiatoa sp. HSG14]|uniref:cyclic nucleotide-binding domain-containing protein n=1 Tax=Candidatus Parabeggiatoa sp. HSG14 TaxID=3055593 RepID=UPI0025A6DB9F|nr:cyclic nucleotide-binding domain-containing protein [Thiotrichales bacterium HSG14]
MTTNNTFSSLKQIAPFSFFDEQEFQAIIALAKPILVPEKKRLFKACEEWKGLYFIVEGKIQFVVEVPGAPIVFDTLCQHDYFGEKSLITDEATDFAAYGAALLTTLLHLSKETFDAFLKKNHELEKRVREYQMQSVIEKFIIQSPLLGYNNSVSSDSFSSSSPVLAYIPTQDLYKLVKSMKKKELQANEILIRQGDDAKEAYIIEKGNFDVHVDERPEQIVRTMKKDELVGEIALIKQVKRTSNVVAQTKATVFVLPQKEFLALFTQQEYLSQFVSELVEERLEKTHTNLKVQSNVKDYKTWLKDTLGFFPVVQQKKTGESGAACLTMVCRYYGKLTELHHIHLLLTANRSEKTIEASMSDLTKVANQLGFLPLAVLSSYEHLMESALPAIVGCKDNHWLVVYQITKTKVFLVDSKDGSQRISKDSFIDRWTSYTLYLKPTEHFFKQ